MRGPQVTVSRTHPNLVKKLFALEVPEIADGSVEIVAVAREAGHRCKIAVRTSVAGLNAKGACIGPMGQRVRNVVAELHGEKIDIVDWAEDPANYVGNALSPAHALVERGRRRGGAAVRVVVPGGSQNHDNFSDPDITAALESRRAARRTWTSGQRWWRKPRSWPRSSCPGSPTSSRTTVLVLSKGLTGAVSSIAYLFSPWADGLGGAG